jgi:UDP-N-acetylmuramate-alanine ligase
MCWPEFAQCFSIADELITLPIYAASEKREAWVEQYDKEKFSQNVLKPEAHYASNFDDVVKELKDWLLTGKIKKGDVIFFLGAGDVYKIIPKLFV